jgi:hypothetical protein
MHPSTYHPYLWLWDENMKVTASARYLNGVLRWMEKKGTMQCMQIGPASGLALISIVERETLVLKLQFVYSE